MPKLGSKVLVIQCGGSVLSLIKAALRKEGHCVQNAESIEPALAMAGLHPPALVILDLQTPGLKGAEACRRLRAHPSLASIPFLVVIGHYRIAGFTAALEAGPYDVIAKPVRADELRVRVRMLLRRAPSGANAALRLRLLGPVRIERGKAPVTNFESRKALALLCYAAVENRRISRDRLAGLFWGEQAQDRARGNLRRVLHNLNALLPGALVSGRDGIELPRAQSGDAPSVWLDVAEFERLVSENNPHTLPTAAGLWQGEFLEGLQLDDCPEFDVWLARARTRCQSLMEQALETLIAHHEKNGDLQAALGYSRRLLDLDPLREQARRRVMGLLARMGQRSGALAEYDATHQTLARELGVEPEAETQALRDRIRRGEFVAVPSPQAPGNLPAPINSFVGRRAELAHITNLLSESDCRLLTLIGPGGVGKTRLALEAARGLEGRFPHGLYFVPLVAVSDGRLLPMAMAHALGLREDPSRSTLDGLKAHLRPRQLLLVLDNFEHLREAGGVLTELLRDARHVKALVTSREALRVYGECELPVAPLDMPAAGCPLPPEALHRFSAFELFVHRARGVRPDFAPTAKSVGDIAGICARLEGMPLAIELAAAHCRELQPAEILSGLRTTRRFQWLSQGPSDVDARQRTLLSTIEWGVDLLDPLERKLFARLSAFAGGWTPEAAEAVCASPDLEPDFRARLARLAGKSLTTVVPSLAGTRSGMLETIREYAELRLEQSEERDLIRARHLDHFLRFAETASPRLCGPEQALWLDRLEADHENLLEALARAVAAGDADAGLRLAAALGPFWDMRGHLAEGRKWLDRILATARGQSGAADDSLQPTLAAALHQASTLAYRQGEFAAASRLGEEALALRRGWDDRPGIAACLLNLGNVAYYQGQYDRAGAAWAECLERSRQLGDRRSEAGALVGQGNLAFNRGDFARARTLYAEGLRLRRGIEDKREIAMSLNNLGLVLLFLGEPEEARTYLEEGLALCRELRDRRGIANLLHHLSGAAHRQMSFSAARAMAEESLAIRQELGDRAGIAASHFAIGMYALDQGELEAAEANLEQSLGIRRELDNRQGIAEAQHLLGRVALHRGDLEKGRALMREGLLQRQALGDRLGVVFSLMGFAQHALADDRSTSPPVRTARLKRGAVLLAAAEAQVEALGAKHGAPDRKHALSMMSALYSGLGPVAFEAAWREGSALGLDEATALALAGN